MPPTKSPEDLKRRLSVTVSPELYEAICFRKGIASKSAYVEDRLRRGIGLKRRSP